MSAVLKPRRSADEHSIPPGIPNFKSFAHIPDARVRRAKEYEQVLLFAQDNLPPEVAERLTGELEWARREAGRDAASDAEQVFRAVKFPLTRSEIAEDTGLSPSTVWKRLQALVECGRVVEGQRPLLGNNRFVLIYRQNPVLP